MEFYHPLVKYDKYSNDLSKIDAQVLEENQITGFSLIDKAGNIKEDPIDEFIEYIDYGLRKGGKYKDHIKYIHETLSQQEKEIEKKNIKIIGAVVVSDKEGLSKLKDLKMIKSSSFGVITDKY